MSSEISPSLKSGDEKRRSVFLLWETLAISAPCSKSQRSYLEFARMFTKKMYRYRFGKNRMCTITSYFSNSIIERVCSRTRLKTFLDIGTSCKKFLWEYNYECRF